MGGRAPVNAPRRRASDARPASNVVEAKRKNSEPAANLGRIRF
ncbi:hypothetical protein EZV77_27410 [Burkholderia thailandensis]|nr:hypothetical protein A8H31_27120 [Burkholderia thailandensis]AVR26242.1 hypothetical protein A8H32_15185 [Burkholderia thailandensis]MDD1482147.1 hypothetical protein [Burkholderia thailandensis]MDD1488574.1 hypothetical protein [Burkholderia thailandensis]MDD1492343.1 hypothetical protein [Burkholderia thailandensis]